MAIAPIGPNIPAVAPDGLAGIKSSGQSGGPFNNLVSDFLQDVNGQQLQANSALDRLVSGDTDNVHDVVLSMAKADLTFQLVLEIRNRLIESYQEIMRMQM